MARRGRLEDGSEMIGVLYEPLAIEGAEDVTGTRWVAGIPGGACLGGAG